MKISSFFYVNGFLCIKINDREYTTVDTVRDKTEIIEWNKKDFKEAVICDITFSYKKKRKLP
jgi:hypothetical protein